MVTIGPAHTPPAITASHGGADATAATPLGPASRLPAALARPGLFSGGQLRGQEDAREVVRSGFAGIDALLPAGGLRRGSLVEWLTGEKRDAAAAADALTAGAGAVTLALAVACRLAGTASGPRMIVVVDRAGWFHPPSVMPWLGDSRQLVVARPAHEDDEIWAIDQALRCHGVAAVVAWPRSLVRPHVGLGTPPIGSRGPSDRVRPAAQWLTAMRRWQLAARSSGAVGLLVRPAAAVAEPSWSEARLAVSPLPGGALLQRPLRLVRVGGGWSGGLEGKVAETVLDLARGGEGSLPRGSDRDAGRGDRSADWFVGGRGGASCRAS